MDETKTQEQVEETPVEEVSQEEASEDPAEEKTEEAPVEETNEETTTDAKDSFGREMHKTKCSDCGNECEVPFKPAEGRPVYCRDCFRKHKPRRF